MKMVIQATCTYTIGPQLSLFQCKVEEVAARRVIDLGAVVKSKRGCCEVGSDTKTSYQGKGSSSDEASCCLNRQQQEDVKNTGCIC